MSFNEIPNDIRTPGSVTEFDSSGAQTGPGTFPPKFLCFGQKLAAGSATANVPVKCTSKELAWTLFGRGSMLAGMLERHFNVDKTIETWVIPQADNGAGAAATGKITFTGTATEAGTINCYMGGIDRLVQVAVGVGDDGDDIVAAMVTAMAALLDLQVLGVVDGSDDNELNLTHRHKGECGNAFPIQFNRVEGEVTPAGITITLTPMSGGTANPSPTAPIAAMGDTKYDDIALPYLDASWISALAADLLAKWGPLHPEDGIAYAVKHGTHGALGTFGAAKNSPHICVVGDEELALTPFYEGSAILASVASYYGAIDAARPFQTLVMTGYSGAPRGYRFSREERDLLLHTGISTLKIDDSDVVRVERLITTYQKNAGGAEDTAYLDVNSILILRYLRRDWNNYILVKYPRHKLGNDSSNYGPGQPIMTPNLALAEALSRFKVWENIGYVENYEQFKKDLIAQRNVGDVNRMDWFLKPDLMNQFILAATQIKFVR